MLGFLSWHSEMLFGAALSVSLAAGGMTGIWWSEIFYLEHKRKEGQKEKSPKSQASFIPALQALTVSRGILHVQHRHEGRRKSTFKSLKCVFSTCEKIWAGKGTQKDMRASLAYDNKEVPVQILQERRSEEERLRSYEPLKSRLGLLFYHFPGSFIWWKSLSTVESVLLTSIWNNVAFGADHSILWLCLWHLQGIKQPGMFMGSHCPVMVETLWQQVPTCLASHRDLCTQHDAQDLVDICLLFVEWANVLIACFHPKPQTCNYNWPKEILNYTFGRRFKIVGKTNLSISTPKRSLNRVLWIELPTQPPHHSCQKSHCYLYFFSFPLSRNSVTSDSQYPLEYLQLSWPPLLRPFFRTLGLSESPSWPLQLFSLCRLSSPAIHSWWMTSLWEMKHSSVQSELKKGGLWVVNGTLGWKRGDLRSGSGSSAAWISEFGHISASLHIGVYVYKIKTLDHRISKETSNFRIQRFC